MCIKYNVLFFILVLMIFSSCKKESVIILANEQIQVTFENMENQTKEFVNLIEGVSLIPLDIDSVIIPALPQLRVTNENIYMFSNRQQELYIYSNSGKYINKISRFGKGPNEYINAESFSLNSKSDIILYDLGLGKYLLFTKHGKFIKEVKLKDFCDAFVCLNDTTFAGFSRVSERFISKPNAIKVFGINGELIKSFLQLPTWINESSIVPSSGSFFSINERDVNLTIPYSNIVYQITPDTFVCKYNINFGNHSVPTDFMKKNARQIEKDPIYFIKQMYDNKWAALVDFYQENSGYVFFQYLRENGIYYTLHNKHSKKTLTSRLLSLPEEWVMVIKPFLASDNNGFYTMINANQLDQLLVRAEYLTDMRLIKLMNQYKNYKSKVNLKEDDFVLVYLKLKKP